MSVASRVAGWSRWAGGRLGAPAGPMAPAGETTNGVFVELFIGDAWTDITRTSRDEPGVYYRDAISIQRGQSDEAQELQPSTCSFSVNNRDGRFSPRNPLSPYYGLISRNTPVRVGRILSGTRIYRFCGEISEWPIRWDPSGTDVYVPVQAYGPTRRLGGQGSAPLRSALYRALTRTSTDDLAPIIAYWPMEDEEGSAWLAAATVRTDPMRIYGTIDLAASDVFAASDSLPTLQSAQLIATVPRSTTTNEIQVRFLLAIPSGGITTGTTIARIDTTGDVARWELYYTTTSGGSIGLRGFDGDGTSLGDMGAFTYGGTGYNGLNVLVSIEIQPTGSSVAYGTTILQIGDSSGSSSAGTPIASSTVGRATVVQIGPGKTLGDTVIGHLTVQSEVTSVFDIASRASGYNGERSTTRFLRLCGEESVQATRIGSVSTPMGPQRVNKLVILLTECWTVDQGFAYEARDYFGYAYKDRSETLAMTAAVTLDYAVHELADAPEPIDDDQAIRNDVTVSRPAGSTYRAVQESGPMSPTAVGRYETSVAENVYADSQLPEHAFWRLHMGTVDEARWPRIDLNLFHPSLVAYETLALVLSLEIGQRIDIMNPPAWLPPETIGLIVNGYTERFTGLEHTMTLNCSPASPWTVAQYDTAAFKFQTAGSQLTSAITDSTTSISVTTTLGPVWTQDAGDMPITVKVGGEQMTVSAVSGSSSPQTFTVTRSANGITKSHPAGTAVELATDAVRGLIW